jgi:phenylacetic acid degradation operon negative regulatory protein
VSAILDDMDSRPGSTTSLMRTVIGLYLRGIGGWISIANLVELMAQLDVSASASRTAVARLKSKELLRPRAVAGVAGYEVNSDAVPMLEGGDRRIFSPRIMGRDDAWCLISFSIPESRREARHQLRRRLHWIGCGTVSPALWICPDFLRDEVEDILADLELRECATLFRTERPLVGGGLKSAIARWWDLGALESIHRRALGELSLLVSAGPTTPGEAFARYVRGVDAWRVIPYLDPGLSPDLLPADWPGGDSVRVFDQLVSNYRDSSWEYMIRLSR